MKVRALVPLLLVAGCRRCGSHESPSDAATVADDSATAVVIDSGSLPTPFEILEDSYDVALDDKAPWGNDAKRATCGMRKDCSLLREKSAGAASGMDLSVVTALTMPKAGSHDEMEVREQWVLGRRGGALVYRAQIANEYVTKDRPIDETLTVSRNGLVTDVNFWPTSSWQTYPKRTFQLYPPTLTSFEETPTHFGSPMATGTTKIDFVARSGDASFACATRSGKFMPIPGLGRLAVIPPARGLGSCATDVDGTKDHGWMRRGTADSASAHFRVLAQTMKAPDGGSGEERTLLIEVHDDRFTPGDQLQIGMGRPAGFFGCDNAHPLALPTIYTVDEKGTPSPSGLAIKKVFDSATVRMFELSPEMGDGISIAQFDDDGKGVERIVSTTPAGQLELGDIAWINDVSCVDTSLGPVILPISTKR